MTKRLDGQNILPKDLTKDRFEGSSIVENIILSSSNYFREFLRFEYHELLPQPIPKFVTRKNPSLDNYFADLLLRTSYEPVNYLPTYEEHIIRGSQDSLDSDLNPRLVGAVLIGIGGRSNNPDFLKVYDEHTEEGTRKLDSASEVVIQAHIQSIRSQSGLETISPMRQEINFIDSTGGASFDHIFTIAKDLHIAQFKQPGFVSESLDPQWKRAIIGACLMSVCVSTRSYSEYNNEIAISDLKDEFERYLKKATKLTEVGFLEPILPNAIEYVRKNICKPGEAEVNGEKSFFTLRRILFGLKKVWDPLIVSFIMGFLFEAKLQAQNSFLKMQKQVLPIKRVFGKYVYVYYTKRPLDKVPHRGILFKMNKEKQRAIVVVTDPVLQITSIFRNNYLFQNTWKTFHKLLIEKESEDVWYAPIREDGTLGQFILNGTESFVGVPISSLSEADIFKLYQEAISIESKKGK